jgi:hypothetical protein
MTKPPLHLVTMLEIDAKMLNGREGRMRAGSASWAMIKSP